MIIAEYVMIGIATVGAITLPKSAVKIWRTTNFSRFNAALIFLLGVLCVLVAVVGYGAIFNVLTVNWIR